MFVQSLNILFQDKNVVEQIVMVKGQLGELKEIVYDNIKKMEEREDNLEDLSEWVEKLDEVVRIYIYIYSFKCMQLNLNVI